MVPPVTYVVVVVVSVLFYLSDDDYVLPSLFEKYLSSLFLVYLVGEGVSLISEVICSVSSVWGVSFLASYDLSDR